jgi:hypothetical protein
MQELLDELDVIECFEQPGSSLRVSEITKKQEELYRKLSVEPQPRYNYSGIQVTQ